MNDKGQAPNRRPPSTAEGEEPLQVKLLNLEQLEAHAQTLALAHEVSPGRGKDRLLPRLSDNALRLREASDSLGAAQRSQERITPAGEWLLDNYHLIDEQIRLAREHLPRGFSRALPHLASGPFKGFPRVYHLALEVIAHVDGRIDKENTSHFIAAYQRVVPLSLGELWAFPIMLRLALLENLRRVSVRVLLGMTHRQVARTWASQILLAAEQDPRALLLAMADMARSSPTLSNAFVAEFVARLQEKGGLVDIPLTWIDHQLAAVGTTLQQKVQMESRQQASNQVSVGSSIGSLRFLGAMPWRDFVEELSVVEGELRRDPACVYPKMDFATRDRYRHKVEDLARRSHLSELTVAALAIELASRAVIDPVSDPAGDQRPAHVGFYLIGRGQKNLDALLPTLPWRWRLFGALSAAGWSLLYFGIILTTTVAFTALMLAEISVGPVVLVLIGLLTALSASRLGVALANWIATTFKRPRVLPRMDLSEAIPDACRTMVVVPSMLVSLENVESLVEGLEVRYLGNRSDNLFFGLLTDLADAETEVTATDEHLLGALRAGLNRLNARHSDGAHDRFFLFHRDREHNAAEHVWMGYERKRGKLEALNHLLRGRDRRAGANKPAFSLIIGDQDILPTIAYVITLDTDTQLPPESAHKLIGTMAHPLNRARYDPRTGRVTEGYGILQPRVAISLPATRRSWFVRLYAGDAGTDPYTLAVSDVYQDLFGEGSYIGKGIYDVDAFLQALDEKLPDNLILSHDLIEGCFARSGLVSDVLLYEDHPSRYEEDIRRRRRWIRGDWQIVFWLLPWAPTGDDTWHRNHISWLSQWKILDNLRRSGVPISSLLLLVVGLAFVPERGLVTGAVLAYYLLPPLLSGLICMLRKPADTSLLFHLAYEGRATARGLSYAVAALVFLPNDALNSLDAILRSCMRMFITRKRLLDWRSPADHHGPSFSKIGDLYRSMAAGPILALLVGVVLFFKQRADFWAGASLLALWVLAPLVAAWLSHPLRERREGLSAEQTRHLRDLARKTWRFFDTFVGPEDNWLPPDNFQEFPAPVVAHRTSPTNIGMSLLANLAAHDFGYISTATLLERTGHTFDAMEKLERFRQHFYNWYDTRTLQPLVPLYVSTVDSGNLTGLLLTLESGLEGLACLPIVSANAWRGLADTIDLLIDAAPALAPRLAETRASLNQPAETLDAVRQRARQLELTVAGLMALPPGDDDEVAYWIGALDRQLRDVVTAPLATLSPDMPAGHKGAGGVPTNLVAAPQAVALALALASKCAALAAVDYEFLYDASRHLLTVGYNVVDRRRDTAFYDLLASEARLVSYVAISLGDLPQAHWFALGRLLTSWRNEASLLSWSGSMFEFLMPLLVMPTFPGTLLDQTYRTVVRRQIAYGDQIGLPWGMSESGYNATDMQLNYQYKAFGVPGLGFKRGLADERVIAPYATLLALMVAPEAACSNLQRMRAAGFEGRYGFYEAIDYTPARLSPGHDHAVIRSFMAHHEGMGLLALAWLLLDQPMQRRFRSRPEFKATELLLHERIPRRATLYPRPREVAVGVTAAPDTGAKLFVVNSPDTFRPEVHLLSNGRYAVMITNAGGGYSRWKDLALTRWREDPTRDPWGNFCYVRDVDSDQRWSAAHQPTVREADSYEAIFPQARAEFRRRDHGLDIHTEIAVSPDDDVELRRLTITNLSSRKRVIELTSYAEVVLAPQAADDAHPAFSNLFVHTEIVSSKQAILCYRRSRSDDDEPPVLLHMMSIHQGMVGQMSFETNRRTFVGRCGDLAAPAGTMAGGEGSVLDPIIAIRGRVTLLPEETVSVHYVTGVGPTRESALGLVDRYRDRHMCDRVFELAWTHRQIVLGQLNISESDAQLYLRLASAVVYASPLRRAPSSLLVRNRRGQSSLWAYGISGDLPIVLVRLRATGDLEIVRQAVRAHGYWRVSGLRVDLVICTEDDTGYQQGLQEQIIALVAHHNAAGLLDAPGGIYIRRMEQLAEEDRVLIQTVARIILTDLGSDFAEQVDRRPRAVPLMPLLVPRRAAEGPERSTAGRVIPADKLLFANGMGGFAKGGREYRIRLPGNTVTPAPWANLIANPHFGTLISESGAACTWCENAHEFRLTPWENDALRDGSGEAFFLRDEESGACWSPTALPIRGAGPYVSSHGFGYSRFEHSSQGVESEMTTFVAIDAPVKMVLIKLTNRDKRARKLSVTGYVEWVLGELRAQSLLHVTSEIDSGCGALLARNPYHSEFGARIGFFDVSEQQRTLTGDRGEFLGRNGRLAAPDAMLRQHLSGRVGVGLDAAAAMQAPVSLAPGESHELCFVLGVGRNIEDVRTLISRFGQPAAAREALKAVEDHWREMLGGVQIETPDPATDVLINGWLPYQVIACRLWARAGTYQSGGAYGFRDQLQDAMSLLPLQPRLLRDQILRSAGRQFREGDVQHWWHPSSGRGVRTHCSDDMLWLPAAVARYVHGTGDIGILDVQTRYIEGRQVKPEEEAYGDQPRVSQESATLYDHCVRAIQHGMTSGVHGLPLMGSGDWNDGMNLVGAQGKGESVWLAFFLIDVLTQFARVASSRGDAAFSEICTREAARLTQRVEAHGWDGAWYRRAWFDGGELLGSKDNEECQIDSLPQSWAVLSGAGAPVRTRAAMDSVDQRLVGREDGLIRLFEPPFDKAVPNPGYIRGYLPGVRENGGQYTHAGVWVAMAFAQLGDWKRAWELTKLLNPLSHSSNPEGRDRYRVEPYVIAADIYAVAPHVGMGGWSWLTGSAGWMYRLILESLLGLHVHGERLSLNPCVPPDWSGFTIRYRFRRTTYEIVARPARADETEPRLLLDGRALPTAVVPLVDDMRGHLVELFYLPRA